MSENTAPPLTCMDCDELYSSPYWIEATISDEVWREITGSDEGILCIRCIARRCVDAGMTSVPVVLSGGVLHNGMYFYNGDGIRVIHTPENLS